MAKKPKKIYGKQFNSVLTEEQYATLRAIAKRNHRSAAAQIRAWIEEAQRAEQQEQGHGVAA